MVVNDLSHPNPFIEIMVIKVKQLIYNVESARGYSHFSCFVRKRNNITALQIGISTEPFLQTAIIQRIVHDSRSRMKFHHYTIYRQLYMIKAFFADSATIFSKRTCQMPGFIPSGIHPNIHVARCS